MVKKYRRKGCDTGILAREKKTRRGKQVLLKETGFERFDSYLLLPSQLTYDFRRSVPQCHPPLVTCCSNTPFQADNKQNPPERGLDAIAVLPRLQQLDGQGEILSTMPVALLTSGTISLNHTLATTIKMDVVVKYKLTKSSLVNETCEF